ncbi:hypothetical protein [Microbispora amethystogenes]|uniref:HTH cro/C1-type domain-containing protein n=1 Tax=Microbispora amethystogenes TaxID=1427754 RepID=A0ABQ4FQ36_9ACTN|nr:hypothetical protein [Microbispora amethystogenes]GIH36934.1 hypothetical protein Mam01_70980 [Microbispora amethystogenes]
MTDPPAGARDGDYFVLLAELVEFRRERLRDEPSARILARAADVSPTTIGNWLRGKGFPQRPDSLLGVLAALRARARSAGLDQDAGVAMLLDERRWRAAYQAEAQRRAQATRTAVQAQQGRAVLDRMRPGWPLESVTDPFRFGLEVHRAIDAGTVGLPALPAYVERDHDRALRDIVKHAATGDSRIAVLVGGSSTGKTRACWEALHWLRAQPEPWRLWHPIEPSRPEAVLADLARIGPHTVIWLNEAQFYLQDGERGERVAAALRNLLRNARRGPVLVLATLWPEYWYTLTRWAEPDRHAHARELLTGADIEVPAAFTGTDMGALALQVGKDSRLAKAADHARDGRITQYLAGAPVLMSRYRNAPPAAKELIHAAMDARRLGCGQELPWALLVEAVPYYLADADWEQLDADRWSDEAVAYLAPPGKAIQKIFTRVTSRPPPGGSNRAERTGRAAPAQFAGPQTGPMYVLADYLDQHGARDRADRLPPEEFWTVAALHALPGDLAALGRAAQARGLYREAAQLWKHATRYGDTRAAADLIEHVRALDDVIHDAAGWAATYAALDAPDAVSDLLHNLWQARTWGPIGTLLARDPAGQATLEHAAHVADLLSVLHRLGAHEQVMKLAGRAAEDVALDHVEATGWLLSTLREVKAGEQLTALARRAAARSPLDLMTAVVELLKVLRKVGADEQFMVLAGRAAAHVSFDEPSEVASLLTGFRELDADGQIAALLQRDPAANAALDHPDAVKKLLYALRNLDLDEGVSLLARPRDLGPVDRHVSVLAARAAMHVPVDDVEAVRDLLSTLYHLGADEQMRLLLIRRGSAAQVPLDDGAAVTRPLARARNLDVREHTTTLTGHAGIAHIPIDDPATVADLLQRQERAGDSEQSAVLLARDPAGQVCIDEMSAVTWLLETLHAIGEDKQVTRLADRAVDLVAIDDPSAVATLLTSLREVRADDHIKTLLNRDPAAHAALGHPAAVARLLSSLDEVDAVEQVRALAARAVDAAVDDPQAVVKLLIGLHHVQAGQQIRTLADRAARHATLDNFSAAATLLKALRELALQQQVTVLIKRLCAAGHYQRSHEGNQTDLSTFGLKSDGSPADKWMWHDVC